MSGRRIGVEAVRVAVGVAFAGSAVALAGCASDSPTPAALAGRQIVLIQSARPVGPAAVTLVRGARAQASRLGYRLTVEHVMRPVVSSEIAVADAVIAAKPAAVVIGPDGGATPAASLQSLRSAGIKVVEIDEPDLRSGGAPAGADAVRRAVGELTQ